MKSHQITLDEQKQGKPATNGILVKELIQYIGALARLSEQKKTGNAQLAAGLRDLAKSLRPFADCYCAELPEFLVGDRKASSNRRKAPLPKVVLPEQLEKINHDAVEGILADDRYTKDQLAELGSRRFGISRSSLTNRSKQRALESVRAALGNEKALDAISEAALKAGQARTS